MTWCKTTVTPLLMHWSYCSLALSHWLLYLGQLLVVNSCRFVSLNVFNAWSQCCVTLQIMIWSSCHEGESVVIGVLNTASGWLWGWCWGRGRHAHGWMKGQQWDTCRQRGEGGMVGVGGVGEGKFCLLSYWHDIAFICFTFLTNSPFNPVIELYSGLKEYIPYVDIFLFPVYGVLSALNIELIHAQCLMG